MAESNTEISPTAAKDYVFDVDRFTSFEGNTGPYILYTIVRIKFNHEQVQRIRKEYGRYQDPFGYK